VPRKLAWRAAVALLLPLARTLPAAADDLADIRSRLEQWTDDFNAGRTDKVCDLFSKEAISNYRGQPERRYDEICDLLKRSLTDPARKFHYELDLREIIVEHDLAVVRLTWTLFISPLNVTSSEPGMDVFRREADGKWRIIRYIAYEAPAVP
jgi:ketosteroid isomerase-like protein